MRILVSACLLGLSCRYDGREKADGRALALAGRHTLIPVCPEQLGGLPTPRTPCERVGHRVLTRDGEDRTEAYQRGAEEALRIARLCGCQAALLKEKSPSCGVCRRYDGTFSGTLRDGPGVTAERLQAGGIPVYSEENLPESW